MKSFILTFVKQHAFVVFVIVAFLISWFPWYIYGKGFLVFGPSIAGIITIAIISGKSGLRDMTKRALHWRVGSLWWTIALFFSGLLLLISIGINTILGYHLPDFTFFKAGWYLAPVFFLMTIVGGPLGEELGWRGFALPYLQRKWNPMVASIIIGTVWGLWHLPLFFQAGSLHYQLGIAFLPVFMLGEITLSSIMTWIYNKSRGSLLVGGIILHNADNFWSTVLITNVTMATALQSDVFSQVNMPLYISSIVIEILVVLILAIVTHGNLGFLKEAIDAA